MPCDLKEFNDVALKTQMYGLLGLRQDQFGPRPVGAHVPLVFSLRNAPFHLVGQGVGLALVRAAVLPHGVKFLYCIALHIVVSLHGAPS